ncbi:UDP-N-acetylmuramate:L-alanyl-gamma-D-glutamyl-meso-diaminopimelate ligase [hydrothermal vent metagenome]|uniref:UDP-N-acetylmuramate:L-alanyl-gamma-D-glutamyl-meso-diaminopimelate ligase n=1 Tax=hydrothermal vent metagenome TaxID=652676 RepID=A0A3B1C5Z5_9ZZZZ
MHVHILGICGTFMGGIALLARALGHEVSGSDANVYPPMSTQLQEQGIHLQEGFEPAHLQPAPDCVVIGNALSRGNPAVEYVLNNGLAYTSGPQWLAEHVLRERWVLAVAGTHGKTTTASLLAWILEANGLAPGFLIGGVPGNFGISAQLGETPFFVVEADEYDTAFFDKRSKFIHYHPRTLILNNLEFDHADIFPDLEAIKLQFQYLLRTVPGDGLIISNQTEPALEDVLARGCWTPVERFFAQEPIQAQADWQAVDESEDGRCFAVQFQQQPQGRVQWPLMGRHNVANALAAIAAARHAGVPAGLAAESLSDFKGIKRRMEVRGQVGGVTVYDDFAHHPTAIASTLQGLRAHVGDEPIIAILEPRSNTMRMGVHQNTLVPALQQADKVLIYRPAGMNWDMDAILNDADEHITLFSDTDDIIRAVVDFVHTRAEAALHILVMSNGGFENIHRRVLAALGEADNRIKT